MNAQVRASAAGRAFVAIVLLVPVAVSLLALLLGGAAVAIGGGAAGGQPATAAQAEISAFARVDIPPLYLRLYLAAAARYGLDWAVLAAIGRVECDHGRDPSPSCAKEGATNSAGAGGPMQFLASTWAAYGVDGNGDGRADRWSPADAIFSAARYLRAAGAPGDYGKAIYAYNHASWYVSEVEAWAARYRGSMGAGTAMGAGAGMEGGGAARSGTRGLATNRGGASGAGEGVSGAGEEGAGAGEAISQRQTRTPVLYVAGAQAKLLRGDGHVALIPEAAPPAVQAMIVAGNELQDLPYGPSGHPDPLGAASEDCSSSVSYVLFRGGVRPLGEIVRENPLAQDYVHWGAPGPGRWVSIYATDLPTPHVFVVIAGLRLDTVGGGTDEGPNRLQGGPRWRLLPYVPTWAHWSVRHPPGL